LIFQGEVLFVSAVLPDELFQLSYCFPEYFLFLPGSLIENIDQPQTQQL